MRTIVVEISDEKYARVCKDAARIEKTPEEFFRLAIDRATPEPELVWLDECLVSECHERSMFWCRCEACIRGHQEFRSCGDDKHMARVKIAHRAFMNCEAVFTRKGQL